MPIIGATVAGAVAVLAALAANGPLDALLVVVAVQQIGGNPLEPLIMGRARRPHPAGVAGALVAVPVTAVTYRVSRSWSESAP